MTGCFNAQAFLNLRTASIYRFSADSLRSSLRREGVAADVVESLLAVLPKSGKVSVTVGKKLLVAEVTDEGWSITTFTLR